MKFSRLTRANMRALPAGKRITEYGIVYIKLPNGDGRFEVNLMANRQRIHRTVGKESEGVTREQVEQLIEKLKTEAREERFKLPKRRKTHLGFKEAANLYLKRTEESGGRDLRNKRMALRVHLVPHFGDLPLVSLKQFEIEKFKKHRLDAGASPTTVNRNLVVLSHLLSMAEEWGWIDRKPCKIRKYQEKQVRTTYLTPAECARLLAAAQQHDNPQVFPFIRIGLETGMRSGEILSIALENIHWKKLQIYLPKTKTGPRHQPISQELATYLKEYIRTLPEGVAWLFPCRSRRKSRCEHTRHIEVSFRQVVKAAGLDPAVIVRHTLRHTLTTHLKQRGVDDPTIMAITGHKAATMLLHYSHTNTDRIRSALDTTSAQLHKNYTNRLKDRKGKAAKALL